MLTGYIKVYKNEFIPIPIEKLNNKYNFSLQFICTVFFKINLWYLIYIKSATTFILNFLYFDVNY